MTKGFQDIDRGYNSIVKEVMRLKGSYVLVGIQAGSKTSDGTDLVQVGIANEFGTSRIPARSFMRFAFDSNKSKLDSMIKKLYGQVLDRRISTKKGLSIIGEFAQGLIQTRISTIRTPPLAESTIKRKKSSKPLIDTGQLRASIRWVVMNE